MGWPLPSLPNPIGGSHNPVTKQGSAPGAQPGRRSDAGSDPLTALWMLSQNPAPQSQSQPAQGLGSQYQMANGQQQGGTDASYTQAVATPSGDEANPFNALAQTMRHDAFASRFPWMGQ